MIDWRALIVASDEVAERNAREDERLLAERDERERSAAAQAVVEALARRGLLWPRSRV